MSHYYHLYTKLSRELLLGCTHQDLLHMPHLSRFLVNYFVGHTFEFRFILVILFHFKLIDKEFKRMKKPLQLSYTTASLDNFMTCSRKPIPFPSLAYIAPLLANIVFNKFAPNVLNNIPKNPLICNFVSFSVVTVTSFFNIRIFWGLNYLHDVLHLLVGYY